MIQTIPKRNDTTFLVPSKYHAQEAKKDESKDYKNYNNNTDPADVTDNNNSSSSSSSTFEASYLVPSKYAEAEEEEEAKSKVQQQRYSDATAATEATFEDYSSEFCCCPPPPPPPPPDMKRSVSFDKIEVRGYGLALGDNPSCSRGPAITLNWDYDEEGKVSVDEYENKRSSNYRRSKSEMIIPSIVRESIIRSSGYSRTEIKCQINESIKIQKSRYKTALQTPRQQRTAELFESTKRKLFVRRRSSKDSLLMNTNTRPSLSSTREVVSMNDLRKSTIAHSGGSGSINTNSSWPIKGILKT